jgi:phosphoserine phosphatase
MSHAAGGGARPRRRHRLIAFDVDGTLCDSADRKVVWQLLNRRFGGDDGVNAERFAAYLRKEISYGEWVDLDVGEWVSVGATREQISEVIRAHLYPVPGARELLAELRTRGYRLAVISGTLDLTLELLFPDHPFEEVFTNRIWFHADGRIAGWAATPYDMEGKAQALEEIARRMGVPIEETVFVGDHLNDLQVMGRAGLAIAFEPKDPRVREAAHATVERDLRGVLPLLE